MLKIQYIEMSSYNLYIWPDAVEKDQRAQPWRRSWTLRSSPNFAADKEQLSHQNCHGYRRRIHSGKSNRLQHSWLCQWRVNWFAQPTVTGRNTRTRLTNQLQLSDISRFLKRLLTSYSLTLANKTPRELSFSGNVTCCCCSERTTDRWQMEPSIKDVRVFQLGLKLRSSTPYYIRMLSTVLTHSFSVDWSFSSLQKLLTSVSK